MFSSNTNSPFPETVAPFTDNLSSGQKITTDPINTSNLSQIPELIQKLHSVKPSSIPNSIIAPATHLSLYLCKSSK